MIECTQQEFEQKLQQLQADKQSGLTGPFIHSAPKGNIFRGPFKERAWMIAKDVVLKKAWLPETGWKYFSNQRRV